MLTGKMLFAGMPPHRLPTNGAWFCDDLQSFFFMLPKEIRLRCRISGSGNRLSSVAIRGGIKVYSALSATGTKDVSAMRKMNRICEYYNIKDPLPKVARRFQKGFGSPSSEILRPSYNSCRGGIQWCRPGYYDWLYCYDIVEAYSAAVQSMLPTEFRQVDGYEPIDRRSSICQHTLYHVNFTPKHLPISLSADKVTKWMWGCELFECAAALHRIHCSFVPVDFKQYVNLRYLLRPLRKSIGNMIVGQNMKKTRWLYLPRAHPRYASLYDPYIWRKAKRAVQPRTRYDIAGIVTAKVRAQLWRLVCALDNPFDTLARIYVDEVCTTERISLSADNAQHITEKELGPTKVLSPVNVVHGANLDPSEIKRYPGQD